MASSTDLSADERTELDTLRARVAALEAERSEELRRAAEAVALAQERAYWLDRWHIDLNRWMATPAGDRFRTGVRGAREVIRTVRRAKRRLVR